MDKWSNILLIGLGLYYIVIVILFFKRNWLLIKEFYSKIANGYSVKELINGVGTTKGTTKRADTKSK